VSNIYDDIINLPHPVSERHPRMPMPDRAAQFAPFQALVGYGEAIRERVRLTDQKAELTEEEILLLDGKLRELADKIFDGPTAEFTYFQPDSKKDGGSYVSIAGAVKMVNSLERIVLLEDGTVIPVEDILKIDVAGS
jgi:hypothetical protein